MKKPEELVLSLLEYAYCERDEADEPQRRWCADLAEAAYMIMENCGLKGVTICSGTKLLGIEAVRDLAEGLRKPLDGDYDFDIIQAYEMKGETK